MLIQIEHRGGELLVWVPHEEIPDTWMVTAFDADEADDVDNAKTFIFDRIDVLIENDPC